VGRILDGPLALPKDRPRSDARGGDLEPTLITIRLSGGSNPWRVRRLNVAIQPDGRVDTHLTWLDDGETFNQTLPMAAIRKAFRESGLDAESSEWKRQRAALLPDPGALAASYPIHDKVLAAELCPALIADLRKLRDEPPPVTVIDGFDIGANDNPIAVTEFVTDGYAIEAVWSDFRSDNSTSLRLGTPLGYALSHLVGDAEECAGFAKGSEEE
jgi:hypothetical protein